MSQTTSEQNALSTTRAAQRQYKGFAIAKGRTFQDYRVSLNGRTRWGTLAEVKQDVDDFLAGTLPAPQRGYH